MSWPLDGEFCLIDFETTGLHPMTDRITEYAYSIVVNGSIVESGSQLINPMKPIGRRISALTGITNEMVSEEPTFESAGNKLWHTINNRILVAHNASFDIRFLAYECKRSGWDLPNFVAIDSLRLARSIFPDSSNHKLGHLADLVGHKWSGGAHRAMADVEALFSVLDFMFKQHKDKVGTVENLVAKGGIEYSRVTNVNDNQLSEKAKKLATNIGREISINYESKSSGSSDRVVTPKEVFSDGGNEFMNAFCHKNQEVRTFNINRVEDTFQVDTNLDQDSEVSLEHREYMDQPMVLDGFLLESLEALRDPDARVRANTAWDLHNYTDEFDFTLSKSMRSRIVDSLILCLSDESSEVRRLAAFSLAHFEGDKAHDALISCLHDDDFTVVYEAVNSLVGNSVAVPPEEFLHLLSHDDIHIKTKALRLYGMNCDKPDSRVVTPFLSIEDYDIQTIAAKLLGQTGDMASSDALLPILDHPNEYTRIVAAQALVGLGDERGLPTLLSILEPNSWEEDWGGKPSPPFGIYTAMETLAEKKVEDAIEPLANLLSMDLDVHTRTKAVNTLGRIGSTLSISPIRRAHNSLLEFDYERECDLRLEIISALANIGGKEAMSDLRKEGRLFSRKMEKMYQVLEAYEEAIDELRG